MKYQVLMREMGEATGNADLRSWWRMGFALWIEDDIARAQGTHEYRPMGVAVVSATDNFRHRDFDRRAPIRPRGHHSFVGLFASLGQVNRFLAARRSQVKQEKFKTDLRRFHAII